MSGQNSDSKHDSAAVRPPESAYSRAAHDEERPRSAPLAPQSHSANGKPQPHSALDDPKSHPAHDQPQPDSAQHESRPQPAPREPQRCSAPSPAAVAHALTGHGTARRRFLLEAGALATGTAVAPYARAADTSVETKTPDVKAPAPAITAASAPAPANVHARIIVNGQTYELDADPRMTLLDALRERLQLTGTKKGCDRGQCGACTVLVNGRRINSCLALAVAHDGDEITTIEGLGAAQSLSPMQRAFVTHDAYQCGYCTPGQICSAVAVLAEAEAGDASAVTRDVRVIGPARLTADEIRERMSGNICRCGAYVNIVAAVSSLAPQGGRSIPSGGGRGPSQDAHRRS
jgi:xanthine dehydrogenase YagT iron-sulfur-binding subunit